MKSLSKFLILNFNINKSFKNYIKYSFLLRVGPRLTFRDFIDLFSFTFGYSFLFDFIAKKRERILLIKKYNTSVYGLPLLNSIF